MIKNIVYFFPTFPHFFVTADDYLFSSKPADLRMLSVIAPKDCLLSSQKNLPVWKYENFCQKLTKIAKFEVNLGYQGKFWTN